MFISNSELTYYEGDMANNYDVWLLIISERVKVHVQEKRNYNFI